MLKPDIRQVIDELEVATDSLSDLDLLKKAGLDKSPQEWRDRFNGAKFTRRSMDKLIDQLLYYGEKVIEPGLVEDLYKAIDVKHYKYNYEERLQELEHLQAKHAENKASDLIFIEKKEAPAKERLPYKVYLKSGEVVAGQGWDIVYLSKAYFGGVAFLAMGPGQFYFFLQDGWWAKYKNATPADADTLLQEQYQSIIDHKNSPSPKTLKIDLSRKSVTLKQPPLVTQGG